MTEERRWRERERERERLGFSCFLSDDGKHTMISVQLGFTN